MRVSTKPINRMATRTDANKMTASQCKYWIDSCAKQSKEKGWRNSDRKFGWAVLNRKDGPIEDDPRKSMVTKALAKTIFTKAPAYTMISLRFYNMLTSNIRWHQYLPEFADKFVVLLKGSNAYKYHVGNKYPDEFEWSDTDIVIYIHPSTDNQRVPLFDKLRAYLHEVVVQTIAEYKRGLDQMLFLPNANMDYRFLNQEIVEDFKIAFQEELDLLNDDKGGKFVSPFLLNGGLYTEKQVQESEENRNHCSRQSFVLVPSENEKLKSQVVMVDVPHYCELTEGRYNTVASTCPLQRTPLVSSFNTTIKFDRDDEGSNADFNLYRLRLHVMLQYPERKMRKERKERKTPDGELASGSNLPTSSSAEPNDSADVEGKWFEKIPADLIDISIPRKNDSDLMEFWKNGSWVTFYEDVLGYQISIPSVKTCVDELDRMINKYDSADYKKEIRERRLAILKNML